MLKLDHFSEEILALWHGEVVMIIRERYIRLVSLSYMCMYKYMYTVILKLIIMHIAGPINFDSQKYDKRIEYFGLLESQDTHDVITNVLLECVMQSIEEMVCA